MSNTPEFENEEKPMLKPLLVVVDIDNNIAFNNHRMHLLNKDRKNTTAEWDAFNNAAINDEPNTPLIQTLQSISLINTIQIVFITGRNNKSESKDVTFKWLEEQGFENPKVLFRYHKDWGQNEVVKANNVSRFLSKHEIPENAQMIVIDDNAKVVDKFKETFADTMKLNGIVTDVKNDSILAIAELEDIVINQQKNRISNILYFTDVFDTPPQPTNFEEVKLSFNRPKP